MNGLASKTVVVYAYTKTDAGKLPDLVVEAFRRPEMGRYIPFTVVVDAAMTNVIAIVPYARGSEQKKLLKAVNKAIFESSLAAASQPIVARSAPVTESSGTRELRTWKAKTGFEVKASLVKEIGEYVVLKKEDGTEATVFLCILTDEDQAYVASLRNTQ
jgi:thiamine pyrophosphate-dependent acetolactate synthase large subunit-like protein